MGIRRGSRSFIAIGRRMRKRQEKKKKKEERARAKAKRREEKELDNLVAKQRKETKIEYGR